MGLGLPYHGRLHGTGAAEQLPTRPTGNRDATDPTILLSALVDRGKHTVESEDLL